MKTIINLSGTSPRLDFVINEFPDQLVPGLEQVETRSSSAEEDSVKMDLVYQITRALLRNMERKVYTEPHDLVAVKDWFAEIFGNLWDAAGFAEGQYPDQLKLAYCKDSVRAMAHRLMYIQTYQKLLNNSVALTDRSNNVGLDAYPGLLTIAYKGPAPDGEEGWAKHSLRIIKEIPKEVLISLHDLYNDESIPRETIHPESADVPPPVLAHRVMDPVLSASANESGGEAADGETIPATVTHDNAPVFEKRPHAPRPVQYEQSFRTMDFADLSPRDKALAAAVLERAAMLNSQELLTRMFRPHGGMAHRHPSYGDRAPMQRRPPYGQERPSQRFPQEMRTN